MTSIMPSTDPLTRLADIDDRVQRCTADQFGRRRRLATLRWAADDLLIQIAVEQGDLHTAPPTPLSPAERHAVERLLRDRGLGRHLPTFPEFIDRQPVQNLIGGE